MATEKAILAGGCFWGMEELFRKLPGIIDTRVGYTGGHLKNPKYKDVTTETTGHAEALEFTFNPNRTSYRELLQFFFQIHDPSTVDRQGNDRGDSYRSAIFYLDDAQKKTAQEVIAAVDASGKWPGKVVTQVAKATEFYEAEKEHQDYLQHYPEGYTCHFIRPKWTL